MIFDFRHLFYLQISLNGLNDSIPPAPIEAQPVPKISRSLPIRKDTRKIPDFQWIIIKGIQISLTSYGFISCVISGWGDREKGRTPSALFQKFSPEKDQQRLGLFSVPIDFAQL